MKNTTAVPASTIAKHGGLGVLVGALFSLLVAGGQVMFNTGLSPQIPTTAGVIALVVSLAHSAYALMQNNSAVRQELGTLESRLGLSPALLAQLEPMMKALAPVLAAELMKIKTPPVAALKQQPQPVPQPVQQAQPVQQQYSGGYSAVSQVPDFSAQVYNLTTQQYQAVPPGQGYPGHGG